MNRLKSELRRLYLPRATTASPESGSEAGLIDGEGRVRALMIELTGPADWDELSTVWRGLQSDFELPAPATAVSGTDGLQLWLSLREAVGVEEARRFMQSVRRRFLPHVAARRIRLWPPTDPSGETGRALRVPYRQPGTGYWSAFIAADLAPVFAATPWLETTPPDEGQADVLARLHSIEPAAWDAAFQRLANEGVMTATPTPEPGADRGPRQDPPEALEPRQFLREVLNDVTAPLALRVEAAKALLNGDPKSG